jgi:hypothetical protein
MSGALRSRAVIAEIDYDDSPAGRRWHSPAQRLPRPRSTACGSLERFWHLPRTSVATDILSIGDHSLLWASALAWLGIGIAIVTSALAVYRPKPPPDEGGHVLPRRG